MEDLVMRKGFWKGKKVLITGYEGFVGSHLTKRLLSYGADILGLDIKTGRKETILKDEELNKVSKFQGSVENLLLIRSIIRTSYVEIVFHLAAEALVNECLSQPLQTFSTNIQGTWNILEASANGKIKAVIIASSDKAYGIHKDLPYKETSALKGNTPYDVSKACADLLAQTYFYTYGVPVAITRCGNIYGPGDYNSSRIVPDAIQSIIRQRPLLIRSNGKFTRDYIYIDDIIDGHILLAEKMEKCKLTGEAFNFSNEKPISVLELVEKIYEGFDRKPNYRIYNLAKYEIKNQYLSSEKARKLLGWKPKYVLDKGLLKTIEWYENKER